MKKKTQIVTLLDDLRSEDAKKRFSSVQSIKEIATAIGPARVRTQFVQYLTEFIDDQQYIVLELMNQLQDFAPLLGGDQHEKTLLPLLISFCKTDEKKQAEKSTQLIQSILLKNKDLIVDVIKKLYKTDMNTSKEATVKLISNLVGLVPQSEAQLIEIYSGMIFSQIPAYKIMGSKYLTKLLESVKNKEEIGKFLQVIYNDNEDLPKIFALEALINYYSVNSNLSFAKFKALFIINNWRLNIKICESVPLAMKVFSKVHFKSTFQPSLLKMLISPQPQLRCKACVVLKYLASTMSQQQIRSKLIPAIKKLSADQVDYVKVEMSQNIVGLIEVCSQQIINEEILPIIFTFIKSNQLAVGIIKNFQAMTKKLSSQMLEEKILTPLVSQFNTQNWRVKCKLIQLLGNVVNSSLFLNDKMATMLVNLASDKISAVRQKATQLIINIICQQSPQWCDNVLIPKLLFLRQSLNYIQRQILLQIIQKTTDKVSDKTLNEVYKPTIITNLGDKIPNVKAKALKVLRGNKKLGDKAFDKYVEKLKTDMDCQVREIATLLKV